MGSTRVGWLILLLSTGAGAASDSSPLEPETSMMLAFGSMAAAPVLLFGAAQVGVATQSKQLAWGLSVPGLLVMTLGPSLGDLLCRNFGRAAWQSGLRLIPVFLGALALSSTDSLGRDWLGAGTLVPAGAVLIGIATGLSWLGLAIWHSIDAGRAPEGR
jgi:hypothetical protein